VSEFCIVETAIGAVGLVWSDLAVTEVWLPAGPAPRMRAQLTQTHTEASPGGFAADAATGIRSLLAGADVSLADIPVDLSALSAFDQAVLRITASIPLGDTMTYGEVASALSEPGAAQAVGRALGRNPIPIVIPCHRVVGTGWIGGFSAPGGSATKVRILEIESAHAHGPVQESLPF
jgi:methylated-DNA-[protein]-cysteine S-methyltransferase